MINRHHFIVFCLRKRKIRGFILLCDVQEFVSLPVYVLYEIRSFHCDIAK